MSPWINPGHYDLYKNQYQGRGFIKCQTFWSLYLVVDPITNKCFKPFLEFIHIQTYT